MKLSILILAMTSLMSVSAFASREFVERQQGNCFLASQHSQEKALGDCYGAQFLSCSTLSDVEIASLNNGGCEYQTTVLGQNQNTNPTQNRIFRVNQQGSSCGYVQNLSAQEALNNCRAAGMVYCSNVITVTLSDNGHDYCQVYSLVRGQD